jgi:hypothetical protein
MTQAFVSVKEEKINVLKLLRKTVIRTRRLKSVADGDSWIFQYDPETTKCQSIQWKS